MRGKSGELSGSEKVFVGILAIWPLLYSVLLILLLFSLAGGVEESDALEETSGPGLILIYLFIPTSVLMLSLIFNFIFYCIFKSDRVPTDQKVLWTILLISVNIFALPIFWYKYVWRDSG